MSLTFSRAIKEANMAEQKKVGRRGRQEWDQEGMRWVVRAEVSVVRCGATGGFKQGWHDLNALIMTPIQQSWGQLSCQALLPESVWIVTNKVWNGFIAFSKCPPRTYFKYCPWILFRITVQGFEIL